MFKKSLAVALMGMFMPSFAATPAVASDGIRHGQPRGSEKGQKRSARKKPSGAAAMKRAATKRNNIRKRK